MKNLVLLISTFLVVSSCSKDSDDVNAALEGKWILTDAQCHCSSTGEDLINNTLTFNTLDGTAAFVNNEDPDDIVWIRSGTYKFSVTGDSLKLIGLFDNEPSKSSGNMGSVYSIKANTLTLAFNPMPRFFDDEFTLIYVK